MPLTNWQEMFNSVKGIFNKLPTLVNGKIPVGIDSLNVTLSSNSLTINNDANNPIPVTGNISTGLTQPLTDTQLRATPIAISDNNGSLTVDGIVEVNNFPTNFEISNDIGNPIPISGTVTANAGTNLNTSALALESGGNLASINNKLNSQVVSSSTVTTVNASVSDTTLLASNANRKGFIIFNNSTAILYVLLASGTSSSSNFSILLNQNESLIIDNTCLYTGIIKGIWASATGDCKVTEFS